LACLPHWPACLIGLPASLACLFVSDTSAFVEVDFL
jgi:hypothetical protein